MIVSCSGEFSLDEIKKRMDDILLIPEIRFCGLIDPNGELVAGGFDSGKFQC